MMKISTADLVTGMYVVKLDRSWFKTSFLRHRFIIENKTQLEKLKTDCTHVEIDLAQSQISSAKFQQLLKKYPEIVKNVELEIDRTARFLNLIFTDISKSKSIANKSVQQSIQQIASSILATGYVSDYFETYLTPYPELVKKSLRTLLLTTAFAKHITLNKKRLPSLAKAALLHDIGLAQFSDLLTIKSALTSQQKQKLRSHLTISVSLLSELSTIDKEVIELVAQHHENLDGSGYDKGLRGSDINFSAKMLRVVTIYEAMTRERAYAVKKNKLEALSQLMELANSGQISKNLVSKFIEMLGVYPQGTVLKLNNDQVVKVVQDNHQQGEDEGLDLILTQVIDDTKQLLSVKRCDVDSVIHYFDSAGA